MEETDGKYVLCTYTCSSCNGVIRLFDDGTTAHAGCSTPMLDARTHPAKVSPELVEAA